MTKETSTDVALRDPASTTPYEIIKPGVFDTPMSYYTILADANMARDLLMYNIEPVAGKEGTNRKASKVRIEEYRDKMLADRWHLNPQPIIFSEMGPDGELQMQTDGQQRLKAVVEADKIRPGILVPLVVCVDAPVESRHVVDQGKARTAADFFRMYGEKNSKPVSDATKMLYCVLNVPFQTISLWRNRKVTPEELREFLAQHEALRQGIDIARDTKTLIQTYVGGVTWYLMWREYGPYVASEFMNGLEKGLHMDGADPRYKLRELLSRRKMEGYSWDGFEQLALLIAAANAWLHKLDRWDPKRAFNKMMAVKFPQLTAFKDLPLDAQALVIENLPEDMRAQFLDGVEA